MAQKMEYREDIDWLRAVAVLSVVAFHFEMSGVHGGFVGVDVFFVISGYLIARIIQDDVASGAFSFARFYERRVRRLLPALYVMVFVTAIPALYYLLTSERQAFFKSVSATVTFTSNFLFWSQSGYFDRDAIEKPLLHTWSLAVEEQFYLFFPLILWALAGLGRRARFGVLSALAMASFLWTYWLMQTGRSTTAFFMSPARAWEFLIGSLLATGLIPKPMNGIARVGARWSAIFLILVPALSLRQGPGFPGLNALAPCIGAAVFIWAGTDTKTVPRAPYSVGSILQFFGKISYSLYLWHWPAFIFARFAHDDLTLSWLEKVALFALTTLTSYLSWQYVERPFRQPSILKFRRAIAILATSSACLIVGGILGATLNLFPSNVDRAAEKLNSFARFDERNYGAPCFRVDDTPFDVDRCAKIDPRKLNVVLWGDSHAAHYFPGLSKLFQGSDINLMLTAEAGCMPTFVPRSDDPERCKYFAALMRSYFSSHTPDVVILSSHWLYFTRESRYGPLTDDLKNTIAVLTSKGVRVVVLGPSIQFKAALTDLLIRALSRGDRALNPQSLTVKGLFSGDRRLRDVLPKETSKFRYLSVLDTLCPERKCPLTVDGDAPLVWDYGHLTIEGSKFVAPIIAQQLRLAPD